MHAPQGWSFRIPPGWPIPPAGWTPPPGWQPDPTWPAPPPGWVFWVPTPVLPGQRPPSDNYWATPRRSQTARGWLMALYVAGFLGGLMLLGGIMGTAFAWDVQPADYPTQAAYDAAWSDAFDRAMPYFTGVAMLASVVLFGALGQRAGYRGAGPLLVLVPIWGYVVMSRILWRWTDIAHWQTPVAPPPAYLPPAGPIGLPHHQRI